MPIRREIEHPINLEVNAGINVKPLTGEQKAGVKLAYCLLILILIVIVSLLICFYSANFDTSREVSQILNRSGNLTDTLYSRKLEEAKLVIQEKKEYREFIIRDFQYIIGILLPVLTSILGYIFGTRAKD